ncbi:hypothetical protein [Phascolarctobacterium succinatutens]|uniref:hypothetical protein n=1 Tax=Phascolarctobacterium succinatutens TaxID=626940 RepID=UPI0023F78CFD|nr:hypothetical protein [Phascolarctobacterium succinatutens]
MTPRQRAILTSIGVTLGDFPDSIGLDYSKPPKLVMTLTQKAAGFSNPINMQDTRACFEAWCLIIKAKTKTSNPGLKIELNVNGITVASYHGGKPANGHLGRFLYRILKFSEQYAGWFQLSPILDNLKNNFKTYLDSHKFVTSAPSGGPKKDIANYNLESYVEYLFCDSISAQKDILGLSSGTTIDRQLPVSLFDATKSNTTGVFTGGKSAIDFWAVDGDTINVYELKSDNPMVGIITEIFFYSNYVHDVFISKSLDHGKGSVEIEDGTYRSYDKIKGNKGKQVKGIMLSNSNRKGWHSSLGKPTRNEIKRIMNANGMFGVIQYEFLEYQLNPLKIGGYYISK